MNRTPRVRAPELVGRGWLNTDGPVALRDLRGRFVLLDFWTFCCVNCLHVLDELRPVEEKYADELVVIGVHSPKFVHEADPVALAAAVERYSVHHPVLDDPELVTWQAYTARAWPTLVLIDPEGYVVAQYAGEGHAHAIDALLAELIAEHRERGTLQPGDSPYVPPPVEPTDLRFPAKAVPLPGGGVLVADAGHDQVVELDAEGAVVRRFDGFREPNGLCLLPADVAAEVGYDVVVADTVGHRLRGIALATGEVRELAGDGSQWMQGDGTARLSSPWDVAWWQDRVWVAMAGIHQLWTFDPRTGEVAVAAGTTNEGLLDGPAGEAWFAQTSGLAPDGERLWLADSETSSLRYVLAEPSVVEPVETTYSVHTAIGSGLFDFGFRDGPADRALLQHPLGVTVLPDGSVAVCDTYNGAVRRHDPASGEVTTLAADLAEPSGAYVDARAPGRRRVRRPPADPAPARGRGAGDRGLRAQHAAAGDRGVGLAAAGRLVRAAAGAEGRRPVRAAVPAGRRGHAGGADPRGRRARHGPGPHPHARPAGGRGRPAHRGPRRLVRPRRRRGGRVPDAPAGLGCAGPGQRDRRRAPGPAAGRLGLTPRL